MENFSLKYRFSLQKLQAKLDIPQGFSGMAFNLSLLV